MRENKPNLSEVNRICDEFDSVCQTVSRDDANAHLVKLINDSPTEAIPELLRIDIEYRVRNGEKPDANEYRQFGVQVLAIADQLIKNSDFASYCSVTIQDDFKNSTRGQYELAHHLGEGGMGQVWLAKQHFPIQRQVAIKVLRDEADSVENTSRFVAERQLLGTLNHPHIAKVHDGGKTDEGRHYLVMELIAGVPINEYCLRRKLSLNDTLKLMILVCRSLHHAHEQKLVHRDVKPSNVLVSTNNGTSSPVLIDFGLAKSYVDESVDLMRKGLTDSGKLIGTLNYMSPEQAGLNGHTVDRRSDIYSLGILLYELLTGSTPLNPNVAETRNLYQVLESIKSDEPELMSRKVQTAIEPFRGWEKQLRGDLDWIVKKAMDKIPETRYQSAANLAEDIEAYLKQKPVSARRPTIAYQSQKFFSRHRVSSLVAAAGLAICLVAGAFAVKYSNLADRATGVATKVKTEKFLREVQLTQQLQQKTMVERDLEFARYSTQISGVQDNLEDRDVDAAVSALNQTKIRQRGWEYYYLLNLAMSLIDQDGKAETTDAIELDEMEYVMQEPFVPSIEIGECVTMAPDKTVMAVVADQNHIWIVDSDSQSVIIRYEVDEPLAAAAFTANGKTLFATTNSGKLLALDRASTESFEIANLPYVPTEMRVSLDGQRIFVAIESDVLVLSSKNGHCLLKLRGHENTILRMYFASEGTLVTIDDAGGLKLWGGDRSRSEN